MKKGLLWAMALMMCGGAAAQDISVRFSLRRSASLVTSPAFKVGGTFTVKTKGYEKTFTLSENFTTVR